MEFLEQITLWHWMILGVVLVILEVLAPGIVFLWMGIAAIVTGVIVLAAGTMGWEYQVLVFAALSVVSVVSGRMWVRSRPTETDHPTLNRRGEQYIGRVFVLETPLVNGVGKLRVDDTTWKINGSDLPAGTRVRITQANGTVLQVELVDDEAATS